MHHGSEGECGNEAAQKVLNTHTQDGHTWGSKHVQSKTGTTHSVQLQQVFVKKKILLSALLHCSLRCSTSKLGDKAVGNGKMLKCLLSSLPPPNTCSVSSEGKWQSSVSGETQRNHRAYLLPLTLNYSLKPPEFLPNKTLQSATEDCRSHTDAPTDQTGRVGSGGLSCNIEKCETECFLFFFFGCIFLKSLYWFSSRGGRGYNVQSARPDRGTDSSSRDE